MAEELKNLIEKIQEEGIKAAQDKAKAIEDEARRMSAQILEKARREAEKITLDAKARAASAEASGKAVLKQAARDLLISLRKEIEAMLDRIVTSHVHRALEPEELAKILSDIIKERAKEGKADIVISLRKEDLEKLEKGFLSDLRAEMKKGLTLKTSDEIRGGFLISYDSGKSYYDFTDKALARYISLQLKPKLAELLSESSV